MSLLQLRPLIALSVGGCVPFTYKLSLPSCLIFQKTTVLIYRALKVYFLLCLIPDVHLVIAQSSPGFCHWITVIQIKAWVLSMVINFMVMLLLNFLRC